MIGAVVLPNKETPHVLSLGAGVQSSTMALMAAYGELTPMPIAAIFADTKAEPASVYTWLDWLERQLPFPVYRVTARQTLVATELTVRRSRKSGLLYRRNMIPAFGRGGGIFPRRCTRDFKINPILTKLRDLVGVPRQRRIGIYATQWIGISIDEAARIKPSQTAWTAHRWPLIELGMSRQDCLDWMGFYGFPIPPRSACVFCPYHNDREWARLQQDEPTSFAQAVQFELDLQDAARQAEGMRTLPFLHASRQALDTVTFKLDDTSTPFVNECEGMCGN